MNLFLMWKVSNAIDEDTEKKTCSAFFKAPLKKHMNTPTRFIVSPCARSIFLCALYIYYTTSYYIILPYIFFRF